LKGLTLVGGGGFFTSLAYVKWVASSDESKIKEQFNKPITITEDLDEYVIRTDVESALKKILTSTSTKVSNYWVISGEHGTGKTTTVQKVCNQIGKGIIYVDVPNNVKDFKDALANAIGLNHRKNGGILAFTKLFMDVNRCRVIFILTLDLTWEYAFEQFERYAHWYRRETNISPVIVIDNINRLANNAPEILGILQEGAKDAVGSGLFTAVFVTSDGSATSQMGGNLCF